MLINVTHCDEIVYTIRTADETGLAVGDTFRLIGGGPVFRCAALVRLAPLSGMAALGYTLDGRRQTLARLCDVYRYTSAEG